MNFRALDEGGQNYRILRHLARGQTLTPLQALHKFRALRLGARIRELRRRGHKIKTEMVRADDKKVARYRLERLCRARV